MREVAQGIAEVRAAGEINQPPHQRPAPPGIPNMLAICSGGFSTTPAVPIPQAPATGVPRTNSRGSKTSTGQHQRHAPSSTAPQANPTNSSNPNAPRDPTNDISALLALSKKSSPLVSYGSFHKNSVRDAYPFTPLRHMLFRVWVLFIYRGLSTVLYVEGLVLV